MILLRVAGRRSETHDTVTFLLEGPAVPYAPGQFLTLLVDHYGREVRRSFSLTSSPGDPFYAITVKRKPNGEISRFLQDRLRVGDTISALPPAGRFTFEAAAALRDIGFIAAGSGIAPILPLIRQALREEPQSHVWLIDQNHSEEDVIFAQELEALERGAGSAPRLTRISLLSSPHAHNILPRRLNNANLETLVRGLLRHDPKDAVFYCCGPEALMRMARFTLRLMGFAPEQFRQEHFTVDPVPHPPQLVEATPRTIRLHWKGVVHEFTVTYPTNLLQAALDQGIPYPYSCRGGRCSACAARCTSGKVVMSINDVLTDKDMAEGWVLTCTGYAATDVELLG
ncbi:ferredoxin--NADP reductase [Dinghuibacter silviterrae]|uniref:Ring-1,2-phenylacetyl-CoA epoxidase subunit PaaE n=1 Tax=Dinghuibacter silviterrae TaxID=1539049 RepID=A0A4R8DUV6_9BACT|nr:ferredoxin--NADP reductase [Dinghuibacter silviterrae]TDX01746.1 ring-1,2-phenylacetyl-CoA epoxidase subunit PaaE [Dinghuibacter silviterrae]